MDGNGRWALKKKLKRKDGHREGIKTCIKLINNISKLNFNIDEISFYVFSAENWQRPFSEVKHLFKLIEDYYVEFEHTAINRNFKIRHYGTKKRLNKKILDIIEKVTKKTKKNKGIKINLVFNYGSRDEIVEAANKVRNKRITIKSINNNLYTKESNEPDLIIRTGGELRLSNFMLWQSAYAEFYFTKKLWPDFKLADLNKILINYKNRSRKYGNTYE